MAINNQDGICLRCHIREKFLESFKKCLYCSRKHCNQCWSELQSSDDYRFLIDLVPSVNTTNMKRICSTCMKTLLQQRLVNFQSKKRQINIENDDDDYQLALAISLSQNEADEKKKQKRKLDEDKNIEIQRINLIEKKFDDHNENLLEKIGEAIQRFMNRAKSNCKLLSIE